MVEYYILRDATGSEIGSVYPQATMQKDYDWDSSNSVEKLSRKAYLGFPDFVPNLDYFEMTKKSILTDLISQAALGLNFMLVSPKLKEILDVHNIVSHKFYKTRVKYKEVFYDYFIMQIHCDLTNFIDWPACIFKVTSTIRIIEEVKINSKLEWHEKFNEVITKNSTYLLEPFEIVLKKNFNRELDLFSITTSELFDTNIYISENFKTSLQKNKITGFEIRIASMKIDG
jgi:hypothetical protein